MRGAGGGGGGAGAGVADKHSHTHTHLLGGEATKMEEGEFFAIETFGSTGMAVALCQVYPILCILCILCVCVPWW